MKRTAFQICYREIRSDEVRWIVNQEEFSDPNEQLVHRRGHVRHPGASCVVAFTAPARILLMRQFRYSVERELWELPAGTLQAREENGRMHPVETPEECAARELLEETGFAARQLEYIANIQVAPGYSDEAIHIVFAHDLERRLPKREEGERILQVGEVELDEALEMIRQGEIVDSKTICGLTHAFLRLRPKPALLA